MKIISLESGRTTWLFPTEEILPLGGADGPATVAAITSKYRFMHPPANPTKDDIEKNGLRFADGQMIFDDRVANIVEFVAFNDGIVAVSTSTENAEAFLQDIHAFLVSEFGFREITSVVKKVNVSTVVVEFETSLNALVRGNTMEIDLIGKHLNSVDGTDFPVELARVDFVLNKDPEFRPPNMPRLTLEKRANTPFSQHRFFGVAPIHTDEHLEILATIERNLLTARS